MTEPEAEPITSPDTAPAVALLEEREDEGAYKPPFLRIMATYPTVTGNPETVTVEMNLDDGAPMAEDTAPDGDIQSWFTQLCTQVIGSMRRSATPPIVMTMTGPGIKALLRDRTQHAPDCDGSCEAPPPTDPTPTAADTAGQPVTDAAGEEPRAVDDAPDPTREHVGDHAADTKGGE